jgi:hypothetical protein
LKCLLWPNVVARMQSYNITLVAGPYFKWLFFINLKMFLFKIVFHTTDQWFPTGVPWHTRVLWEGLKQCFSNFFKLQNLSVCRNLHTQDNTYLRILTEPSEEWAEPLVSSELRLKNTALKGADNFCSSKIFWPFMWIDKYLRNVVRLLLQTKKGYLG